MYTAGYTPSNRYPLATLLRVFRPMDNTYRLFQIISDRDNKPGILIYTATGSIRVYRCIGKEFWLFIGRPDNTGVADFVLLEVLLAIAKALAVGIETADLETRINVKSQQLAAALSQLQFPRYSLIREFKSSRKSI